MKKFYNFYLNKKNYQLKPKFIKFSKMSKFFKTISKKISNATQNLFSENNEFIKNIFFSLQSNEIIISPEKYASDFIPINKYFKQEHYTSNPILYIAVVSFNHKKGSIIEFTYPDREELLEKNEESKSFFESLIPPGESMTKENVFDNINNQLTYLCMPDGAHSLTSDSQFFLIQNFSKILFGISCYRQIKVTQAMKEDEQENTRDSVQKSMCIISKLPLFGQMAAKLSITMLAYFNQDSLKDKKIIKDLYINYDKNYLDRVNVGEILVSFSLKRLIYFTRDKIFSLIKLLMLEKKILVYSHVSNNICSFMFSFLSLFPGGAFFSLDNTGRMKCYYNCYTPYGLPLKFLNKNSVIYSILTLYDIDKIEEKNIVSYFIGTTNPLLMNYNKIEFDCVINLDDDKITFNKKLNMSVLNMGKKENLLMKKLKKECKSLFDMDNSDDMDDNWMLDKDEAKNNKTKISKKKKEKMKIYSEQNIESKFFFEGSDDYIRGIFLKYITNFLSDIQLTQHIISDPELDNESKLSKIKDVLGDYNCNFILKWITSTKNFLFWNYEHSKDLWKLSTHLALCSNVTKLYENGDIYKGELSFGLPNNHGKMEFTNKEVDYTYVGEFMNGLKHGKGNLSSKDNKFNYEGDFVNDKFEGFGTWIDHGEKYTGNFKEGKFHGNGNLYKKNGDIYDGEFEQGVLIKGKINFNNGDSCEGDFIDGNLEGKGIYTYKNGDIFKGNFVKGQKKFGEFIFNEGKSKYKGFFENDKFCGEGILIDNIDNKEEEKEEKGVFKDGILVEKLDRVKFEKENILENSQINIEITQEDDWEVATIKKVKYRHKKIISKKSGIKKEEKEKNEIINEGENKNEIKDEINDKNDNTNKNEIKNEIIDKEDNQNEIEIKINNEK